MQPYYVHNNMLDPIERSLYHALHLVICQRAFLFTKVHLSDLISASAGQSALLDNQELTTQRADFVLCDRNTTRPLAIILLLDPNHSLSEQSERIGHTAKICTEVGLPVVGIQRQSIYAMHDLSSVIEPLLANSSHSDDFTNGDRIEEQETPAGHRTLGSATNLKQGKRQPPLYPGYGVLRALAGKLS
ncbi:MAG: DUF2726 domain-containing protein [Caldilineaceae bacterium]